MRFTTSAQQQTLIADWQGIVEAKYQVIVTIYQNFHLVPHLSVAENLAIRGFTTQNKVLINWSVVYSQAKIALEKINFPIDAKSKVKDLSIAKKQMLEIAIALSKRAEIIIMDEPTAALRRPRFFSR